MITHDTIQEVVKRLISTYNPLEIYLFGSYAHGEPHQESDLDILVVVESSKEKTYKRSIVGYEALWGLGISKDLLVYTKDEFQESLNDTSTLPYHAKHQGKCLYARA